MVRRELEKMLKFCLWCDLDLMNAFHQFILAAYTASRLAVTTPWGVYEPIFLPEGIALASIILQERVKSIFADFDEWMIVLFDNILIMANTYEEMFARLKLVIERCVERHVMLKISKCFFGVTKVNFFGYEVTPGKYTLSQERKDSIQGLVFPKNLHANAKLPGLNDVFLDSYPNVL